MTKRRPRVVYTPEQERGLRIVGAIVESARKDRGYSLREWAKHLVELGKNSYTHTDIGNRYEKAGLKTDKRATVPNPIAPQYLADVAEFTPYSLEFLKEVLDGKYTGAYKPVNLKKMLEDCRAEMGDFEFNQRRQYLGITEAVYDRAITGAIVEGDDGKLAALLKVDVSAVWAANISSLDDRINGED